MAYNPPDYGGYTRQKADVEYKYGNDATQNAYRRSFGRQYAPYKSQFGARGLSGGGVDSGVMNQQMGEFVGDYSRGQQRAYQDQTLQNQSYDMGQAQSDQWRQQALQGIEETKANDIAWTAQNITELKELLGGL